MQFVWSPEEDQALLDGLDQHGKQWKKIVQKIPGRNVNQARNRYLRLQEGATRIGKNRCQWCRQTRNGHICLVKMMGGTTVDIANPIVIGDIDGGAPAAVQPGLSPHASSPLAWLESPFDTAQAASEAGTLARALDDVLQSEGLQTPFVVTENEAGGSSVPDGMCLPAVDVRAPFLASDGRGGRGSALNDDDDSSMTIDDESSALFPPQIHRLNTHQLSELLVDKCWPDEYDREILSLTDAVDGFGAPPLVLASSFEQPPSPIEEA